MKTLTPYLPLLAALLALAGALIVSSRQISEQVRARAEARRDALDRERREAYIDLLVSARRLRDIPLRYFQGTPQRVDPDPILVEMYSAIYRVRLIAPKNTADLANQFFDATIEAWRLSRAESQATAETWKLTKDEVQKKVQQLRRALRAEYGDSIGTEMGDLDYP